MEYKWLKKLFNKRNRYDAAIIQQVTDIKIAYLQYLTAVRSVLRKILLAAEKIYEWSAWLEPWL